jgi:hypothetical protein
MANDDICNLVTSRSVVHSLGCADTIEAEAFVSPFRGRNLREGLAAFLEKRVPALTIHETAKDHSHRI